MRRRNEDDDYYSVVDVDSSQFTATLATRLKQLESALENCSIDPLNRPEAVNILASKSRTTELCCDLREVYDILLLEEFDDMDKFVKLRNYYSELKNEYDMIVSTIDKLLIPPLNKTLSAKL